MERLLVPLISLLLFIPIIVVISFVMAFPVKWLWNYLMPVVFGLPVISVWQAWALNILCGFLFKGSNSSK